MAYRPRLVSFLKPIPSLDRPRRWFTFCKWLKPIHFVNLTMALTQLTSYDMAKEVRLVTTWTIFLFHYSYFGVQMIATWNPRYTNTSHDMYIDLNFICQWKRTNVFQDIAKTVSQIPKGALKENIKVNSTYFTHIDFVFAKDADILIYKRIVDVMLNATYGWW